MAQLPHSLCVFSAVGCRWVFQHYPLFSAQFSLLSLLLNVFATSGGDDSVIFPFPGGCVEKNCGGIGCIRLPLLLLGISGNSVLRHVDVFCFCRAHVLFVEGSSWRWRSRTWSEGMNSVPWLGSQFCVNRVVALCQGRGRVRSASRVTLSCLLYSRDQCWAPPTPLFAILSLNSEARLCKSYVMDCRLGLGWWCVSCPGKLQVSSFRVCYPEPVDLLKPLSRTSCNLTLHE